MKQFFKASLITGSAFLINLVTNTIRAKAVAVFLGPEGLGALAQINAFTTLAITISSLGMATSVVRVIADYNANKRVLDLKRLIITSTLFAILVSGAATLGLLLLTPQVSSFIFGREFLTLLVAISLLNIPVSVVTNLCVAFLQGFKEIKLDAGLSIFSTVFTGILMIGLLIPFKLDGAVVGSLVANYITSVVFFVFLLKTVGKHLGSSPRKINVSRLKSNFQLATLSPLKGIAIASLLGGGAVNLADILVRSHLIKSFGLTLAGGVQPALSISLQYTALLSGAIGTYGMARLSEVARKPIELKKEHNDLIRFMILAITPAAAGIALLGKYLVTILYSAEFAVAEPLIPLQAISDVLKFVYMAISSALYALGRGKVLLGLGLGTSALYFMIFVLTTGPLGLNAIPFSSGISWILGAAVSYGILRRTVSLRLSIINIKLIISSVATISAVALLARSTGFLAASAASFVLLGLWLVLNVSKREWLQAVDVVKEKLART